MKGHWRWVGGGRKEATTVGVVVIRGARCVWWGFERVRVAGGGGGLVVVGRWRRPKGGGCQWRLPLLVNKPDSIQAAIQADHGPGRIRSVPITVANWRTIRVSAVGISDTGRALANTSSLHLRWELNNCDDLAFWDDADKFRMSKNSWERYLALKNATGLFDCELANPTTALVPALGRVSGSNCTVRATVQSHPVWTLGYLSLDALTDAIRLQVVSTLQVFPEFALLLFNPHAKVHCA
ncbi:hypothetical protein Cgig2_011588 [Carnegiea gigantea]|uniref:Uncharacterized protein n=1 Tax=Carnegiea gigantea TaxID=171969 RepID=A0A9Q1JSA6_9CARY|nr:hypothetical protein Cgig2_011588 [Carnegiea gigantea]